MAPNMWGSTDPPEPWSQDDDDRAAIEALLWQVEQEYPIRRLDRRVHPHANGKPAVWEADKEYVGARFRFVLRLIAVTIFGMYVAGAVARLIEGRLP